MTEAAGEHGERLRDLLELESDPAIIELTCPSTGVPAWPAIRNDVFRTLISDRFYRSAPIVDLERRPSISRLTASAVKSALHSVRRPLEASDVLIVGTGAGLQPRDGTLFNRITDYFAEALGARAWNVEGLFGDRWPAAPRWNRRLSFLGVGRLRVAATMRLAVRDADRKLARTLVERVSAAALERLGTPFDGKRRAAFEAMAARRLAAYPVRARLAKRILHASRARVVLLEDGSFGVNAVFNAVAHDAGVHVAEFQHGMITSGHDAYNVHPRLAQSDAFARAQPMSFLLYGEWWSRQMATPARHSVIGNPHRSHVLSAWRPAEHRDALLVLGDGVETDLFLSFCRELARTAGPLKVRFRPHPAERAKVARLTDPAVEIDREPDLYRSFATTTALIGESSTALYEGTGLIPRVAVWDTPKSRFYLGEHPFPRLTSADQLPAFLAGPETSSDLLNELWATDWRRRFVSWIEDRLASPQ
jgi:hypothetical protein